MNEAKQMQANLGVNTVVKLKYPVRLATGQMLEQVTLRRLRVGDLRAVSHLTNEAEQELALFARMASMIPEDFDCLDLADWKQLQETFRRFTESEPDGK
ncbi:phage tail assembly protein [Neisseria lactamica]|nr:phage tail assembly protein [Neisseria lactamica]